MSGAYSGVRIEAMITRDTLDKSGETIKALERSLKAQFRGADVVTGYWWENRVTVQGCDDIIPLVDKTVTRIRNKFR